MIKTPKKIKISGLNFNIIIKKDIGGGYFDIDKQQIVIGTKNKAFINSTLIHEIFEIILTLRGHRYSYYNSSTNDKLMFVFNHSEFTNICDDVCSVLDDFKIKL